MPPTPSSARWRDGKPLSPIDGMPIAIKDIIETADMPTGQGSPMLEGQESHAIPPASQALREAGAIIIGKTTTTEFAATHPWHKTQNPHDGTRTPGGSSSGSAAAVGAGMVPAGLGTQVVGSILRPSSFCGASASSRASARSTAAARTIISARAARARSGRRLADTWAVLLAITERAGGDPG